MSTAPLYPSASPLPESARRALVDALQLNLADGLDLHAGVKTAHWNVRGPHFQPLHELFESIATELGDTTDELAERAVILGGRVGGDLRTLASASRLAPSPMVSRGNEHLQAVSDRVDTFLSGLRTSRTLADQLADDDTADLLTGFITAFEKRGWFLRATLDA